MCRTIGRAALLFVPLWWSLGVLPLPAQEPVSPPVEEPAVAIPESVQALPVGQDVRGRVGAARPEAWYVVDLSGPGDGKSLVVDLKLHAGARGDVDMAILDSEATEITASSGTGDTERCLLPIDGLEQVYVRVFLYGEPDELRSDRVRAEFTLRAELSPRECVLGVPVFIDDLPPLRDGDSTEGQLPNEGADSADTDLFVAETGGTGATVARFSMAIENPEEADIDLRVYDGHGEEIACSTGTGSREACFVPTEGQDRLFVAAYLADSEDGAIGRYTLSLRLSEEQPGPDVVERVRELEPKRIFGGQRVLGQVTGALQEFWVWLFVPGEQAGHVALNPADRGAAPRLTVRNGQGWIVGESAGAPGLCVVPFEAAETAYFLIQVTADEPCGFSLCASGAAPPVSFDPERATSLAIGTPATGEVQGGVPAVFRLQVPVSAAAPLVTLKADPLFADLDLLVCAGPDAVLSASRKPGGSEATDVPIAGAAPVYVVVTAPEGVSAEFELSVQERPPDSAPSGLDWSSFGLPDPEDITSGST